MALLEHGPWEDIPGLFLPSKILELCVVTMPNPPPHIQHLITLLAWVTPVDATEFYSKLNTQAKSILEADQQCEQWKNHPLYVNNTKEELEKLCRSLKVPVKATTNKHQLVILICSHRGEEPPSLGKIYSGQLANIPTTVSAISHLPIAMLRQILHYHGYSITGSKDQLTLNVYLL